MNNKTMLQRSLLTTGITLALGLSFGLSQNALAESTTSDLEIKAGLAQAYSMDCGEAALDFGVITLVLGDRAGSTTILVKPTLTGGAPTVGGTTTGVTAGSASAGKCILSGSSASNNDPITVTYGSDVTLTGEDNSYVSNIGEPATDLSGLTLGDFDAGNPRLDADGGVEFRIGGTLTIPATVAKENLGGYSGTITVTADDS
jgi:hypothetical protein